MKTELQQLLDKYGFVIDSLAGKRYLLQVYNKTNCQFNLYLQILSDDETIRIWIAPLDEDFLDGISLFETVDIQDIETFIQMIN